MSDESQLKIVQNILDFNQKCFFILGKQKENETISNQFSSNWKIKELGTKKCFSKVYLK